MKMHFFLGRKSLIFKYYLVEILVFKGLVTIKLIVLLELYESGYV